MDGLRITPPSVTPAQMDALEERVSDKLEQAVTTLTSRIYTVVGRLNLRIDRLEDKMDRVLEHLSMNGKAPGRG